MMTNKPPLKNHYFSGGFPTNLVTLHRTIADSDQLKITLGRCYRIPILASPFFFLLITSGQRLIMALSEATAPSLACCK